MAEPIGASGIGVAAVEPRIRPAVQLGVHHIATGRDHLLFLIMLLLPAPLVAVGGRWRERVALEGGASVGGAACRVVHVVTAFAVGHSCILVLGALGWVELSTSSWCCAINMKAFPPLRRTPAGRTAMTNADQDRLTADARARLATNVRQHHVINAFSVTTSPAEVARLAAVLWNGCSRSGWFRLACRVLRERRSAQDS